MSDLIPEKERHEVEQFKQSWYYKLLEKIPNLRMSRRAYIPMPPGASFRMSPCRPLPSQKDIFRKYIPDIMLYQQEGLKRNDSATAKECQAVLNHVTSLEDFVTSFASSYITALDPLGGAYSHFTGKKTLGGCGLYNMNFESKPLANARSGYSRAGKALGYAGGCVTWVLFPLATACAEVAMSLGNIALLKKRKHDGTQHYAPVKHNK